MSNLRDHLSAWFVVALLAATAFTVLSPGPGDGVDNGAMTLACADHDHAAVAASLPRRAGLEPDARLVAMSETDRITPAYEIAEERNLARYHGNAPRVTLMGQASGAAETPTGLC